METGGTRLWPSLFTCAHFGAVLLLIAFSLLITQSARGENRSADVPVGVQSLLESAFGEEDRAPDQSEVKGPEIIPATGYASLDQALRLIHTFYAHEVSVHDLVTKTVGRLSLAVAPHCLDSRGAAWDKLRPAERLGRCIELMEKNCGLEREQAAAAVLRQLVRELDPHSSLLDQRTMEELKISTEGKFGGLGLVVAPKDGDYVVVAPMEGSPAHRKGIRAGDTIVEIDGCLLHGLPLMDVLSHVRGPVGSQVTLMVKTKRGNAVRQLTLRRKVVHIPPVRYAKLKDGIGYLRIVNFQDDTRDELERALRTLFRGGRPPLKGMVLDLRDNAGGLFKEAIRVAHLFLPAQVITVIHGRNPALRRTFSVQQEGAFSRVPLTVLINHGSASAAEILVGALQVRPDVLVMGRRSFGKASIQAVFPLGEGMGLRLTVAHYRTPDGRDIEGNGIVPDVLLEESETTPGEPAGNLTAEDLEHDREIEAARAQVGLPHSRVRTPFMTWY